MSIEKTGKSASFVPGKYSKGLSQTRADRGDRGDPRRRVQKRFDYRLASKAPVGIGSKGYEFKLSYGLRHSTNRESGFRTCPSVISSS